MHVTMAPDEWKLLAGFAGRARHYVEFGSGASTVLAAETVGERVISFDSSKEWLARVAAECQARRTRLTPRLSYVDIGEVGDWGFPKSEAARALWPQYHSSMWADPELSAADFYLIDGRFRVACFAQALLHAGAGAFIAFHDYASRPHYHAASEVGREIVRIGDLSIFMRASGFDREAALRILAAHAHDPR